MKVKDLLALLVQMNLEADVIAYDAELDCMAPVTGLTFTDDAVAIHTDDMDD